MTKLWGGLSLVWQFRIRRSGAIAAITVAALLLIGSAVNGVGTVWHWFYPSAPPPIAEVAREEISASAPVSAFAERCVTAVLQATAATTKSLGSCNPPDHGYVFDKTEMTTTTITTGVRALRPKFEGQIGDVSFWAVQVQVDVRTYPSAPAEVEYYSIPVAISKDTGPAALDRITRVDPPAAGPVISLDYGGAVKADSEIHGVLSGFIVALLSGGADINRYITTDSGIAPIGGYWRDSIKLTAAETNGDPNQPVPDGAQLSAHIEVTATRADRTRTDQLSYPLTLRCVGGTWFVAGIDAMPTVSTPQESNTAKEGGKPHE